MKCVILRSNSKTETYSDVSSESFSGSSNGQHKVVYSENISSDTTFYYKVYTYSDGNMSNNSIDGRVLNDIFAADNNL